jgi:hypothetical protein
MMTPFQKKVAIVLIGLKLNRYNAYADLNYLLNSGFPKTYG